MRSVLLHVTMGRSVGEAGLSGWPVMSVVEVFVRLLVVLLVKGGVARGLEVWLSMLSRSRTARRRDEVGRSDGWPFGRS